ncbi:hypothetical protein [Edaphobacillus lindanitolerans]|uniref:Uncharacterized protein n=1 Tax=Edaphobacillus lindanitolerans TaxID=550447 RepID=A0A1U7PMP9_9BACI|nr:hypothetical protein [Edaphobacillus lindanitolerans]SIT72323.1 hypothetical protein SAMN05428946_0847 [Edaphobacillus lindanitolerans]
MRRFTRVAGLLVFLLIMLAGCKEEVQPEAGAAGVPEEEEPEEAEPQKGLPDGEPAFGSRPMPIALKEVVEYPAGEFASDDANIPEQDLETITDGIPALTEGCER